MTAALLVGAAMAAVVVVAVAAACLAGRALGEILRDRRRV